MKYAPVHIFCTALGIWLIWTWAGHTSDRIGDSELPSVIQAKPEKDGTALKTLGGDGEFSFGLWYGGAEGVSARAGLTQEQFMGFDENIALSLEFGKKTRRLSFSSTDPDFMEGPFSRTLRMSAFWADVDPEHGRTHSYDALDLSGFLERRKDNGLSYRTGAGVQRFSLEGDITSLAPVIASHAATYGAKTNIFYTFGGVDYDRAEKLRRPGHGYRLLSDFELGRAASVPYAKVSFGGEVFKRLAPATTLRVHGDIGLSMVGGEHDLPMYKTYRAGGVGSVRGYEMGSLGPQSQAVGSSTVAYVGGQSAFSGGIEVVREFSGRAKLDVLGFIDVGGASGTNDPFEDPRGSIGMGLKWYSPVGPLSLDVSKPLGAKSWDAIENVQFTYGVVF